MCLVQVLLFSILLSKAFLVFGDDEIYKVIDTINGKVRGIQKSTKINGYPFFSFRGIPYAKPPIGKLRFKAPEPIESWRPKVIDATDFGPNCMAIGRIMSLSQNEDCLMLNIFVPVNANPNEKLPALFYIHGGGYVEGSGSGFMNGPDILIEKQVIFISFNYRLGTFGFLSFNTSEYSGNMGLKDQQLALKWVYENIDRFGGDKGRITISGNSAGATSAHLHVLSSESRKYIQNAILMSGTALNYFAMVNSIENVNWANKILSDFGVQRDNLDTFLQTVDADELTKYSDFSKSSNAMKFLFSPNVERSDAVRPFMIESPEELFKSYNDPINVLVSFTSQEGLTFISFLTPLVENAERLNENFIFELPFRDLNVSIDSPKFKSLAEEIRQYYFKDLEIKRHSVEYETFITDVNFAYDIEKFIRQSAEKSAKIFYLRFSVDGPMNLGKNVFNRGSGIGAAHGDDLCYVLFCEVISKNYESLSKNRDSTPESKIALQAIENLSMLYSNFIKFGEPTHQGKPLEGYEAVNHRQITMLDVSNDGLKLLSSPNEEMYAFWSNIEKKARNAFKKI